jgi:hypothetical protein
MCLMGSISMRDTAGSWHANCWPRYYSPQETYVPSLWQDVASQNMDRLIHEREIEVYNTLSGPLSIALGQNGKSDRRF